MHVSQRVIRPLSKGAANPTRTQCLAKAMLPTKHGVFESFVFRCTANDETGEQGEKEHIALVYGDVQGQRGVTIRVHSECITSEVFGSLKCDCKDQLDAALAEVVRRGAGAVFYLRQEGRGIGLANKIRAYALQAQGADTVDANRLLGLPDDARKYDVVRDMIEHLGIQSVRLMTNNPAKMAGLRALGVEVEERISAVVPLHPLAAAYVETKRSRMAHEVQSRSPLKATGSDTK